MGVEAFWAWVATGDSESRKVGQSGQEDVSYSTDITLLHVVQTNQPESTKRVLRRQKYKVF